jgi:hypothetical protein
MHGHGTYFYSDGDSYTGEWQNDKRHGVGKVVYCDEPGGEVTESYDGDWKFGHMHGRGKYTYKDKSTYEGEWAEGKMEGED